MTDITPVILAAGDSSRMGFPKASLPLGGSTFLGHILDTLDEIELPAARVILGNQEARIKPLLIARRVHICVNPNPERGQFSSMRLALENLPTDCRGCLIWPVDQPLISAALVRNLIHLFLCSTASLAMPICGENAGHPAVFGRGLIAELLAAPPEGNPKLIVARHKRGAVWLPTEEKGVVEDIDTPEDYRRLTGETLESALERQARGRL